MAGKQGQRLTQAEVEEFQAYRSAGLAAPDKYDNVVLDNASRGDAFYRYKSADEEKADAEAAKAEVEAVAAQNKLFEKLRAEAAKRAANPDVPAAPVDGRPVAGATDGRNG